MQDSPFWMPMPILKSINMPKVPWSCSNWCSGSLEDKVKVKERVQWARRAMFKRGTIIEKEKYGWESGSTTSPSDPLHLQSGNQFYFQRLFLTNSVSQFHSCTIKLSPELSSFSISYGGLLGTSWDQSIRTPWRCGYTQFWLFLGVAEDLFQSLTLLESALHLAIYNHWQRVDDLELVIWVAVWGGWETWQWDDEGSDGDWSHEERRGKRMLGALGDCKITITVIKYGVWFSCSIYGHHLKCFSVITFWETSSPLYAQPLQFGIFLICAWECRALVSRSIVSESQSPCHVSILSCISCISLVE